MSSIRHIENKERNWWEPPNKMETTDSASGEHHKKNNTSQEILPGSSEVTSQAVFRIRIQSGQWIRIRNSHSNPGGQ